MNYEAKVSDLSGVSSVLVDAGDWVRQGQVMAVVDRSGMQGLRVTRIQHYRDLYERQLKY